MSDVLRRRDEPTQTTGIRSRYAAELYNRFRALKGATRQTVADNNALRLTALADPVDDFGAERDPAKERAFNQWFEEALEEGVLETTSDGRVRRGDHWTASHARQGYGAGVQMADRELQRVGIEVPAGTRTPEPSMGIDFDAPLHRDSLEMLYTRHYAALEGITDATSKEVGRVLSKGLLAGENPRKMARELNDRVDSIGITRARTMARTETLRAANTGALNRYEEAGVTYVEIVVANDDRTCSICGPQDGRIITRKAARGGDGPIYHPQCRCTVSPVPDSEVS